MIRKALQDEHRVSDEPHELEQAMRRGGGEDGLAADGLDAGGEQYPGK